MKIKTAWELNKLFYSSLKDPKLARDVEAGEAAVDAFVAKYKEDKRWLTEPKVLAQALAAYEKLSLESRSAPILYANYRKELNAGDKEAEALMNSLSERFTKRGNKLLFFELELAKVPENIQKKFMRAPELKRFRYHLTRLFETAKHNLSESEERIASLLSDVSFGRWLQAMENLLNTRTVKFVSKNMPLNEALAVVSKLPTAKRRALHKSIMAELKNLSDVAESEINAVVSRKKIMDELRHFAEPVDATILGYENDKQSVMALTEAVNAHFDIAKRFYRVKAKLMKEKTLTYADRSASVGTVQKKISFAEAAELVRRAFYKLHPRYAAIFERLLAGGQVDVYPKAGKAGGAYCSHMVGEPTLVLLNHVDNANSLLTLAHEMGHAIHSERSKTQKPMYEPYSIVTAETASTFFERAAFEALVATLSEKEKMVALHDRVQDDVSTVFRQIACFNFEVEMHTQIREKGLLTKEELAALMNKHMAAYVGDAVKLSPDDGYFFVAWSHIRRFFYVYSYAYGQLVSRALWERVQKNKKFISKVDEFLTAGGSASPEDIFKKCGLNLYSPKVFLEGLKSIEKDVAELEQAVAKGR
jgi:oligoendopeptidase F